MTPTPIFRNKYAITLKWFNSLDTNSTGRPIQNITDEIVKDLNGDVIASVPMIPMVKKYTEFKQRMPKNARKFNFKNFETKNQNSMYHNEFLPYRTAIPKEP